MEILKKLQEAKEALEPYAKATGSFMQQNGPHTWGAMLGLQQAEKRLGNYGQRIEDRQPMMKDEEIGKMARQMMKDIRNSRGHNVPPVGLEVNEQAVARWDDTRRTVVSPRKAQTMAHEMGHAKNFYTPEGRLRQRSYGAQGKLPGRMQTGTRMIGITAKGIQADPDSNPSGSILSGMISNLLDPHNLRILREEAAAWKHSRDLSAKVGAKYNPRMAAAFFSTYPTALLKYGARQGALGWLYGQGLDKGLKGLRDGVIDPILHNTIGKELAPVEKSMQKYGYDRNLHRFQAGEGMQEWKIEPRYGKRPR